MTATERALDLYRRAHMAHHKDEMGPTEPDLDHFELAIASAADQRRFPLLAICRGIVRTVEAQRAVDHPFLEEHAVGPDPPAGFVVQRPVHHHRLSGFAVAGGADHLVFAALVVAIPAWRRGGQGLQIRVAHACKDNRVHAPERLA